MIRLRCDKEKEQPVRIRGKVTGLEQVRENESIIHHNAGLRKGQEDQAANQRPSSQPWRVIEERKD